MFGAGREAGRIRLSGGTRRGVAALRLIGVLVGRSLPKHRFRRPLHNGISNTGGSINEVGWRFQSFKINDLEMVDQTGIEPANGTQPNRTEQNPAEPEPR